MFERCRHQRQNGEDIFQVESRVIAHEQAWTAKGETKFPGNFFLMLKNTSWGKFDKCEKSKTKLEIESGTWYRNHFLYFQIGETKSIWDEISEYF